MLGLGFKVLGFWVWGYGVEIEIGASTCSGMAAWWWAWGEFEADMMLDLFTRMCFGACTSAIRYLPSTSADVRDLDQAYAEA